MGGVYKGNTMATSDTLVVHSNRYIFKAPVNQLMSKVERHDYPTYDYLFYVI